MHEIRATLPAEHVGTAVRLANDAGIDTVAVSDVYIHGVEEARKIVSVETSTARARAFVDALLSSATLRDVNVARPVKQAPKQEGLLGPRDLATAHAKKQTYNRSHIGTGASC